MNMQKVNPHLIPIKGLYFLYYAGLSSFIPYKSIYQKQLGMSSGQNGFIQATMQLVSLFSPPIAGFITDKTKAYKVMMTVCMFFSIAFTIPFYFVPPIEREVLSTKILCCEEEVNSLLHCLPIDNASNVESCLNDVNAPFDVNFTHQPDCLSPNVTLNCKYSDSTDVYGSTFAILIALTMLMSFFLAPVTPLVDSSAMDTLGIENVKYFGIQRLWGAVGFGIVGLAVSYFTDVISPVEVYGLEAKNYILAVVSAGLFWGATIVLIITSIKITAPKAKAVLRGVGKLLIKPQVLAFIFVVLVSGFCTGVQYSYLFWYMTELNGFKQYILGLSLIVTCASEIPMFWFSGWICQKFGYVSVLALGLIAASIRFFTYTFITDAWQVLLVEGLHGISFALPNAAICSYAAVIAPKDATATLISISQTAYWGLGNMLGALLGGILYEAFGGVKMFRIVGAISVITAVLYEIIFGHLNLISYCYCCKDESKKEIEAEKRDSKTKIVKTPEEEQPLHEQENGVV
ncbi:major facilitator superfamily domain-containing protein 6-like [Styela clava]|uniref:major facilitator superfamily domain-containing protein 6-like n=1 Tax=Styela clava TaxID=7725 RepID=UPI001939B539|nr:major facilitator superfamily domain-containing protein 6-like [Styela clava]